MTTDNGHKITGKANKKASGSDERKMYIAKLVSFISKLRVPLPIMSAHRLNYPEHILFVDVDLPYDQWSLK
jgi:hypothetical protein